MKIVIANDHRGVDLKNKIVKYLKEKNYTVENLGTDTEDFVDFPDYAFELGNKIANQEADFGILICGSGIGMSIAANKVKGIRCANIHNKEEAKLSREHNNANVIALSANMSFFKIKKIINIFLNTSFSKGERYHVRLEKIEEYEAKSNA